MNPRQLHWPMAWRRQMTKCELDQLVCNSQLSSLLLMLISIAVYDLGGGTFDISILEIQKGVFEVN